MSKESQDTLLKELDITLTRAMVRPGCLRGNDHWVSDGGFLISVKRLVNTDFIACGSCLHRLAHGQRALMELTKEAVGNVLDRADEKLKLFRQSNVLELHGDKEYVRFEDSNGGTLLIARIYVDGFGLSECYAQGPGGMCFDHFLPHEVTLAVAAFVPEQGAK